MKRRFERLLALVEQIVRAAVCELALVVAAIVAAVVAADARCSPAL